LKNEGDNKRTSRRIRRIIIAISIATILTTNIGLEILGCLCVVDQINLLLGFVYPASVA
jgi:hypothetical protein